MSVDLYNSSYAAYSSRVYQEVRQETYGQDLGQTGWMTWRSSAASSIC